LSVSSALTSKQTPSAVRCVLDCDDNAKVGIRKSTARCRYCWRAERRRPLVIRAQHIGSECVGDGIAIVASCGRPDVACRSIVTCANIVLQSKWSQLRTAVLWQCRDVRCATLRTARASANGIQRPDDRLDLQQRLPLRYCGGYNCGLNECDCRSCASHTA
jgi:hypothetical protein